MEKEKTVRYFDKVLKLDKKFHVYIHGGEKYICMGEDEQGKFIKLRYDKIHGVNKKTEQ